MDTTTYEVLPIGNLDFSDNDELKDLSFDKDSVTSGYDRKANLFLVSATLKNKPDQKVMFRIGIHYSWLISVIQFNRIKTEVLDRAS